jgi:hypothetical protein
VAWDHDILGWLGGIGRRRARGGFRFRYPRAVEYGVSGRPARAIGRTEVPILVRGLGGGWVRASRDIAISSAIGSMLFSSFCSSSGAQSASFSSSSTLSKGGAAA